MIYVFSIDINVKHTTSQLGVVQWSGFDTWYRLQILRLFKSLKYLRCCIEVLEICKLLAPVKSSLSLKVSAPFVLRSPARIAQLIGVT